MFIDKSPALHKGKLVHNDVDNTTSGAALEVVRIGMVARGCPVRLRRIKQEVRREESLGWLRIVAMDDDCAVIEWTDHAAARVLCTSTEECGA